MVNNGWFDGLSPADIVSLGMLEPIGPIAWQKIYRAFESGALLLKTPEARLLKSGLTSLQAAALVNRPKNLTAAEHLLKTKEISLVTLGEPGYPLLLAEIPDPPLWLYYRGDLTAATKPLLTVVGTRKPSQYALSAAASLMSETLTAHAGLVSGLAYGIDKAAHQLALQRHHRTVAVLAGGLDSIYPADHHRLADQVIESGGALISEYPPLSRPRPYRFPIRNRILAGLAPATVIIEAQIKSGSLTTAKSAIDYNRDLFAVPGDITRRQAAGTNFLIKRGAMLLDDPADLEQYFNLKEPAKNGGAIDKDLKILVDLLADAPLSVDQLVESAHQSVEILLGQLTQLELLGIVSQTDTGAYQITA